MSTRLTIRLDFETGRRLGAGKVALLEAIDKEGSISAAGRAHNMSYRRAWLLDRRTEPAFHRAAGLGPSRRRPRRRSRSDRRRPPCRCFVSQRRGKDAGRGAEETRDD